MLAPETFRSPNPSCTPPANGDLLDCDGTDASAIYWQKRQPQAGAYNYLEYWWYYRFNDAPGGVALSGIVDHEGDWEGMAVATPKGDAETFHYAAISAHEPWWRYLRETLSCDGGGAGSCGSEERPLSRHRVDIAVANGTHANYPQPCSTEFLDICRNTEPSGQGERPDGDYDATREWSRNGEARGLKKFPEQPWVDWPGFWGADRGEDASPMGPGIQSDGMFDENGQPNYQCTERYTPDGDDCSRTTTSRSAAPETQLASNGSSSGRGGLTPSQTYASKASDPCRL